MDRLDSYERKPRGMEKYLSIYGWHFSKTACEWAVSMMKDRNGKAIQMPDKKSIDEQLSKDVDSMGYDAVYISAMAKADYFGSSIKDEQSLYKFVNDYLGDPDGYTEKAFTNFLSDCGAKGIPIIWEDLL